MNELKEKWEKVIGRIEKVFNEELPKESMQFRDDLWQLKDSIRFSEPGQNSDWVIFSQLSNYFEFGFLFHANENGGWISTSVFANGQTFLVDPEDRTEMTFPKMRFNEICKGDATRFLKKLELNVKDPYKKLSALLFQPCESTVFVILTRTAEPWLRQNSLLLRDILIQYYSPIAGQLE